METNKLSFKFGLSTVLTDLVVNTRGQGYEYIIAGATKSNVVSRNTLLLLLKMAPKGTHEND